MAADPALPALVTVTVDDTVTYKTVSRRVDTSHYDATGRALALAVATEELVRSSWAELAFESKPAAKAAPLPKPPPEAERAVRERLPVPASRVSPGRIALDGAVDWASVGQLHVGGEVSLELSLPEGFGLLTGIGEREGLPVASTRGRVSSRWIFGTLGMTHSLFTGGTFELAGGLELRAGSVSLMGSAGGASWLGRSENTLALVGKSALTLRWAFADDWAWRLVGHGGYALAGARALDGTRVVAGVSDAVLGGGVGLEWRIP